MDRLLHLVLASVIGLLSGMSMAQTISVETSVNLAGEQRMLVQRVAKLYSQVGLNVLPSIAVSQLALARSRFESNLTTLGPIVAGSSEASLAMERLTETWQGMKKALSAPVSRDTAEALSRQAEVSLAAAENLTRILATRQNSETTQLINQAGRQRMLSQRIANNYLLRSWGIESAAVRENLERSSSELSAGLAKLIARPNNSIDIQRELEEIAQQWDWLKASLSVEGASTYRLIVAESADAMLEATDRVTRLYAEQGRR
jgi:nitrate/nitrite-specific signal transduction histidine kinase